MSSYVRKREKRKSRDEQRAQLIRANPFSKDAVQFFREIDEIIIQI